MSGPHHSIELHDSSLTAILRVGAAVRLELRPACIFNELYDYFTQDIVIEFDSGRFDGEIGDLPDSILDGNLRIGNHAFPGTIPLPCESNEAASTFAPIIV